MSSYIVCSVYLYVELPPPHKQKQKPAKKTAISNKGDYKFVGKIKKVNQVSRQFQMYIELSNYAANPKTYFDLFHFTTILNICV